MQKCLFIIGLLFLLLLSGCSTIKTYQNFDPVEFGKYKVSIGSQLYSLTVTQDLPNAFGKADPVGGKVKKSFSQLTFLGLTSDNFPIFNYYKVTFESNETAESRYGSTSTTVNKTHYGSLTQSNIQVYTPPQGSTFALEPNSYTFYFDNTKNNILNIDNTSIEIISCDSNVLIYSINKSDVGVRQKL